MPSPFQSKEQRDLFLTLLKVMGGRTARVEFDGAGDSGSIEWLGLLDQDGKEIDLTNATFDWFETASEYDPHQNKWVTTRKPVPNMPVADILKTICEDALEESGHDWYNNEGGYGNLFIDLTATPPEVVLNVSVRVTSTEDYTYDLVEDEEEGNEYADLSAEDKAREELLEAVKIMKSEVK